MPRSSLIRQLYERLVQASEIPIIESSEIISKGLYRTEDGKKEIYIKQSLNVREKLKVLLHEYSHHIHLTHYYNHETRAQCEKIASGSGFLISAKYELKLYGNAASSKLSDDTDTAGQLSAVIQSVAKHILAGLQNK